MNNRSFHKLSFILGVYISNSLVNAAYYAASPYMPPPMYYPRLPMNNYLTLPRPAAPSPPITEPIQIPSLAVYPQPQRSAWSPQINIVDNNQFLQNQEAMKRSMQTAAILEVLNRGSSGADATKLDSSPARSNPASKKTADSPLTVSNLVEAINVLQPLINSEIRQPSPSNETHLQLLPSSPSPKTVVLISGGAPIGMNQVSPKMGTSAANLAVNVVPQFGKTASETPTYQILPVLPQVNATNGSGEKNSPASYAILQGPTGIEPNFIRLLGTQPV
jgi:hypothetical protein